MKISLAPSALAIELRSIHMATFYQHLRQRQEKTGYFKIPFSNHSKSGKTCLFGENHGISLWIMEKKSGNYRYSIYLLLFNIFPKKSLALAYWKMSF